jgi:hypothetical protein
MDLKEFIAETLVQIADGIEQAQGTLKENKSGAIINTNMTETDSGRLVTGGRCKAVEMVEFDVAILANEGTATKAGIGLTVASIIKLNASGESKQSTGTESRIKFKVPMSYPMHKSELEKVTRT